MRGSMDVVDAERLQRNGVAMVLVGRRNVLKRVMDYHIRFTILSLSVPVVRYHVLN